MSEFIALRPITKIANHPDADKLVILKVGQFQVVHSKDDKLRVGQLVVHFPTDICINPDKAKELKVDNYCKPCQYKGGKSERCRIVAARIRGVPSYGFIATPELRVPEEDYDEFYGAWKYEPPEPQDSSIESSEHTYFPRYTKIRRLQLFPDDWKEGLDIIVTEKLHGRNVRLGVVKDQHGDWRYMVGGHNHIIKRPIPGKTNRIWDLFDGNLMAMLNDICDEQHSVIVYGEMIGESVQDMDYGYTQPQLRVFDIMVDGKYIGFPMTEHYCRLFGVFTVPKLYQGAFSWCLVDSMTNGGSVVQNPSLYKTSFKGREGVVIRPVDETVTRNGRRLIGKSVSVDYENRPGRRTEYH